MPVNISNFSMADKIFVLEGRLPDKLPKGSRDLLKLTFTDEYGMEIFSVTVDVRDSTVALSCAYNVSFELQLWSCFHKRLYIYD